MPLFFGRGQSPGSTTNDAASAGAVGEYISASVSFASAVSVTTATAKSVTSISLTPGDWDVQGVVAYKPAASTVSTLLEAAINSVDNANPTSPNGGCIAAWQGTVTGGGNTGGIIIPTGTMRISIATTTIYYLIAYSEFTTSTNTAYGFISARRSR